MGYHPQVFSLTRPAHTFSVLGVKQGTVRAAQKISAAHIRKLFIKHVKRRSCVGAEVQEYANGIANFLNKNAGTKPAFCEDDLFATMIWKVF